jgi:hypothetical protein
MSKVFWSSMLLVLAASPAAAQSVSESPSTQRPVEVSIGGGGVASFVGNGGDARVIFSFPRSGQRAFEGFAGGYSGGAGSLDVKVEYGLQVRERIHKGVRRHVEPFWTYGAMGAIARYETSSCVNRHCTSQFVTRPLPPIMGLVGAGVEYSVSPRVAVRVDYQAGFFLFIPIGVRAGASVSIPLGRIRSQAAE